MFALNCTNHVVTLFPYVVVIRVVFFYVPQGYRLWRAFYVQLQ